MQVTVGGQSFSMAMSQEVWEHAEQARAERRTARLPPSCKFYNIYGTGRPHSASKRLPRGHVQQRGSCPHLILSASHACSHTCVLMQRLPPLSKSDCCL